MIINLPHSSLIRPFSARSSNTSSPNHVWRAWYQALHKQSESLLKLLEFPTGNETIRLPSLERNRASLYALRSVAVADSIGGGLPSPAAHDLFRGADIIRLIPWTIAYLSEISRMGAAQHAAPRRGRRKETFKPLLLSRLARVYIDLTGTPAPSIRDTAGDYQHNTPTLLWLRAVLTKAAARLPDCFDAPNLNNASNAIADLLRLQDATLSTLFRDDNL